MSSETPKSEMSVDDLSLTKKIVFTFTPLMILVLLAELSIAGYSVVTKNSEDSTPTPWPVIDVVTLRESMNEESLKTTYNSRMYAEYFAFDSTLGVRFRPSVWSFSLEPDADGNPTIATERKLAINQYGFVSNTNTLLESPDYASIVESDDTLRIYISGGSTSVGWGASDNEHTWPALLQQKIQESLDADPSSHFKTVHVFNSAVFGYSVSQEIKRFMEEGVFLKPHAVLMFNGINERWGYQGNPIDYTLRKEQRRLMDPPNIGEPYTSKILFPYIRKSLFALSGGGVSDPLTLYGYKQPGFITSDVQTLYRTKIEQFKLLCDGTGIEFRYVLQPVMGIGSKSLTPDEERVKAYMSSGFYPSWETYLRRAELFYEGARPNVKENWEYDLTELFDDESESVYFDPRHYNDLGNQLISEKMYDIVQTMNLL